MCALETAFGHDLLSLNSPCIVLSPRLLFRFGLPSFEDLNNVDLATRLLRRKEVVDEVADDQPLGPRDNLEIPRMSWIPFSLSGEELGKRSFARLWFATRCVGYGTNAGPEWMRDR